MSVQSRSSKINLAAISELGMQVEMRLQTLDVGLMMGGEPTFLAPTHLHLTEWQTTAVGHHKFTVACRLLQDMQAAFAPPHSLLHYGVGKLYPGEPEPRWALGCYWRGDRLPLWQRSALSAPLEPPNPEHGDSQPEPGAEDAKLFLQALAVHLALPQAFVMAASEPTGEIVGYVLPLLPVMQEADATWAWASCQWRMGKQRYRDVPLPIAATGSMLGLRLPLSALDIPSTGIAESVEPLNGPNRLPQSQSLCLADNVVQIALTAEVKRGQVTIFLPPLRSAQRFADLVTAIESTAALLSLPVRLEGYGPPLSAGIEGFQLTPDPGVLEVNIHPVSSWSDLEQQTLLLYELAVKQGLGAQKYSNDGRPLSTGGGAHITIGGRSPQSSPLLRRPDLLRSLLTYWQHHPSLSYLFAGQFVGPTSQCPRIDEARYESLYELEVAFEQLTSQSPLAPELIDHLLQPLLIDLTGNAHRTALCIDKLYPVLNPAQQLGLLEFRGFEMPPTAPMRLIQLLLVRSLVAWFWEAPYQCSLIRWGTELQDRFFLPHSLLMDLETVVQDLQRSGLEFQLDWFGPFLDQRFPVYGQVALQDSQGLPLTLELRHALELWPVLPGSQDSTARPVDDSLERLQVRLHYGGQGIVPEAGLPPIYVLCEGQQVPLQATKVPGEWIAGVRFRARQRFFADHAAIAPQTTLRFTVIEADSQRILGGCTYFVERPQGPSHETAPDSPRAAQDRIAERFLPHQSQQTTGHDASVWTQPIPPCAIHPDYPHTLDLRRYRV